jgi:hypothetical protein
MTTQQYITCLRLQLADDFGIERTDAEIWQRVFFDSGFDVGLAETMIRRISSEWSLLKEFANRFEPCIVETDTRISASLLIVSAVVAFLSGWILRALV